MGRHRRAGRLSGVLCPDAGPKAPAALHADTHQPIPVYLQLTPGVDLFQQEFNHASGVRWGRRLSPGYRADGLRGSDIRGHRSIG